MTFNTPLAVKVLAHIEDLNEYDSEHRHNQALWSSVTVPRANYDAIYDEKTKLLAGYASCGTAGCFAGWTAHLERLKLLYYEVEHARGKLLDLFGIKQEVVILHADEVEDGRTISDAACEALGIPIPEVDRDCWHGEWDSQTCTCELDHENWDYEEGMPLLFNGHNNLDAIYAYVAMYAGISVTELTDMVEDEREKYTFDPEAWNLVEKDEEDQGIEVPVS